MPRSHRIKTRWRRRSNVNRHWRTDYIQARISHARVTVSRMKTFVVLTARGDRVQHDADAIDISRSGVLLLLQVGSVSGGKTIVRAYAADAWREVHPL